jgi:chloramphenicol phosphotransferase-like protein
MSAQVTAVVRVFGMARRGVCATAAFDQKKMGRLTSRAMLTNIIVYLVGFSGTGKLTVARELAGPLKARVVDNHWINNPILGLIDNDRVTPFPIGVWDQIDQVREAVLETIATLSARDANFILTHAGHDDDPQDHEISQAILRTADRRRAVFVPVRLLCNETQLVRRVVSPERTARLKGMNPEAAARTVRTRDVLKVNHANAMTLDTSDVSPQESARRILAHIEACTTKSMF